MYYTNVLVNNQLDEYCESVNLLCVVKEKFNGFRA
jgi:hypothetical protein